jgi:hypothetical protein
MYRCVELADVWKNSCVIYDEYKHVFITHIYAIFKQKQQRYIALPNVRGEPMSIETRLSSVLAITTLSERLCCTCYLILILRRSSYILHVMLLSECLR